MHWYLDSDDWRHPDPDDKEAGKKHYHPEWSPALIAKAKKANEEAIKHSIFVENTDARNVYMLPGGRVLMHDVHPQGPRVLDEIINQLEKEHFLFRRTDVVEGWNSGF